MSEIQEQWLEHLRQHGETDWTAMPKLRNGKTAGNNLWLAMVRDGHIVTEFREGKRFFSLANREQK